MGRGVSESENKIQHGTRVAMATKTHWVRCLGISRLLKLIPSKIFSSHALYLITYFGRGTANNWLIAGRTMKD